MLTGNILQIYASNIVQRTVKNNNTELVMMANSACSTTQKGEFNDEQK